MLQEKSMINRIFLIKCLKKGVYFDRDKNDNNYDYLLDSQFEGEGLRYYFHKYFTGYETHYYLDRMAGKETQEDLNSRFKFKYEMEQRNKSMVFRIFSVIRNPGVFTSSIYKGENGHGIYPKSYTGNHLVIFENQLIEPTISSLSEISFEEWIKKHKINHSEWRVSDIDNYTQGNKFFNKIMNQNEFKHFVDKLQKHKSFVDEIIKEYKNKGSNEDLLNFNKDVNNIEKDQDSNEFTNLPNFKQYNKVKSQSNEKK